MIRAILFDQGDTLWHFPRMPAPAELGAEASRRAVAVLEGWGLPADDGLRRLAMDAFLKSQLAELEAYRTHLVSPDPAAVLRELAAERGVELSLERARELWEGCRPEGAFLSRTIYPDTAATLRWARERGYRVACVTNTLFGGRPLLRDFVEEGLDGIVELVVASCDIGYLKPHPKIFEHALEALGVAPEETVMVGDSLRADVGGAKELGMTAVWKRRTDAYAQWEMDWQKQGLIPDHQPDYTVDSLWEITELPIFVPGGSAT
jgi:HAD superfamily hydrolase (TIGR01662 family)